MEFLRTSRKQTLLSETVYVVLNLAVVAAIFLTVYYVGSPLLAFGIVLLSKWRVFAVRPQHWYANILANMVDVIVGFGFVVFLANTNGELAVQLLFSVAYAAWLLYLKPKSKRQFVVAQAGIGLFVGVAALAQVAHEWIASLFVAVMWAIGYVTARHVLGAYKEPHIHILSLVWGLIMAELGWLSYHWTFGYPLFFSDTLLLPQVAIFAILLAFITERVYASYHKHKEVRSSEVILPALFSISLIMVCVIVEMVRRSQLV